MSAPPTANAVAAAAAVRRPKVLVLNPNGIGTLPKRVLLARAVQEGRCDLVILPETHLSSDGEAAELVREWGGRGQPWRGEAFWSHGPRPRFATGRRSRGVGWLVTRCARLRGSSDRRRFGRV